MENSLKDPLEERIELIQDSEDFKKIQAQITSEGIDMDRLLENFSGGENQRMYFSVMCIIGLKNEIATYNNIELYFLCLSNLIQYNLVPERLIESEFLLLLTKFHNITFDCNNSSEDLLGIYSRIYEFLTNNHNLIADADQKQNFISSLRNAKVFLDYFIICIIHFLNNKISLQAYMKLLDQQLSKLEAFSNEGSFIGKDIFINSCNFMKDFIDQNVYSISDCRVLIEFIESKNNSAVFPVAFSIATEIENTILRRIFQEKLAGRSIKNLISDCDGLIRKHNQTFENCKQKYESTEVRTYPNIEDLLCLALKNILESCLSDWFDKVYIYLLKVYHNYAKISLSSIIREIAKFPIEMQYALAEHLYRVGNVNDYKMVIFFVEKVNSSLQYQRIDKSWAEDFINIACSSPYKEYLLPYMKVDNTDLEAQLRLITDTIIRMQLPDGVSGVTFYNLTMCIRLFPESRGCKGASFIIYLHELAHYLQRTSGKTIGQCESPQNWKNFGVREAGLNIERGLFGNELFIVTDEAAEYLVTPPLPTSHEEFLQEFKKRNEMTGDASLINLTRSGGPIYLGRCGSKFSSLNMKEESKGSGND